jgi:HEAT repeat protein
MRPQLNSDSVEERLAGLTALADAGALPDATELAGLDACLGDRRKAVQRRAAEVCAHLMERVPQLRGWLEERLHAPELGRRWGAIFALSLGGVVPSAARPTLLELLGDPDGDVRWAAAELLKRMAAGARAAIVGDLVDVARVASRRRKMALYCLRDLGAPEAAEVVEPALADPDVDTRLAALALLAAVGTDRSAAALRIAELVADADPRMQRAAAGTLGRLGIASPPVEAALRRATQSDDESLRKAAHRSLAILTT